MSSRQCPTQRVVNALWPCSRHDARRQTNGARPRHPLRAAVPPSAVQVRRTLRLLYHISPSSACCRAAATPPPHRTCAALCWQLSTTATTKLFSMRNPKPSGRSAHPEKSPVREVSPSREAARGSDLAALPAAGVQRCRTLLFRPSGSCVSWSHLQRRVAPSTLTSRPASTARAAVYRAATRSLSVKAATA